MRARHTQPPHGEAYAAAAGPEPLKSGTSRGPSPHPCAVRDTQSAEDRTPIKVIVADRALAAENLLLCRRRGATTGPAPPSSRGPARGARAGP